MEMSIKEHLLSLGMKEADFDRYYSDLYIRLTPISAQWRKNFKYKNQTSIFRDNIEGERWIEVPFGAFDEYMEARKAGGW